MDQSKLISQEEKKEAKDHQPGLCWSSRRSCPGGRGTGRTLRRWGTPWARENDSDSPSDCEKDNDRLYSLGKRL